MDGFVLKLDGAGNHVWDVHIAGAQDQYLYRAATDSDGDVVVVGTMSGSVDLGSGTLTSAGTSYDVLLAKFDRDGNHLWSRNFGDAGDDFGYDVAIDGDGNIFICGQTQSGIDLGGGVLSANVDAFLAKFDPDGTHLWSRVHGDAQPQVANGVAADGDGNMITIGSFQGSINLGGADFTSADSFDDIFVVKRGP